MSTVYYILSYGDFKKHAHMLHGTDNVAHSLDDPLTDDSEVILKLSAPDHVHHHFEKNDIWSLHPSHEKVTALATHHPVMKHRGTM